MEIEIEEERLLVSSLYWNKFNYFALSTGTFAE